MTRLAAAGAALLVVLSLTGCSSWFVHDDIAEEPLRERIGDLESVVEVSSQVDGVFGASIFVVVDELVESDLQAIVASADELLDERDVSFELGIGHQKLLSLVYPHEFSDEQLVSEVRYWLALSDANAAPLGMTLQTGRFVTSRNIWDPDKTDPMDWDALRAVPDPSTAAHRSYYLGDMVIYTSIPAPEILVFRDRLAAIELGDDETLGIDYVIPGFIAVRYVSPEAGRSDPTLETSWPRVRQIVSEIAALRLPQSNFVFNIDGYERGATLHLGECVDLEDDEATWTSAELVSALTDSGVDFPLGVAAGFCSDALG